MSGQPYRYAKDIDNFRQDYMEALGLRANLDDMNLQANKQYKETGALPPQSSMKDMRTTPEILADTEKLKLSLIAELKPVCSTQMAQSVVQRVQTSPLNADGSFLVWFAQNAPELVSQLKKKYKFGIAGDLNDVEQMVSFMTTIFSKSRDMSSTVKSAFDRPAGSDALGASVGDFVKLKAQFDEIYYRLISNPNLTAPKDQIKQQLDAMNRVLNSPPNRYQLIKDAFNTASQGVSRAQQMVINGNGFQEWNEYTDKLPSPSQLRTLLEQLNKSDKNANTDLSLQILLNISSILPTVEDSTRILALTTQLLNVIPPATAYGTTAYNQPVLNPVPPLLPPPPPPPPAGAAAPAVPAVPAVPPRGLNRIAIRPPPPRSSQTPPQIGSGIKRRGRPKGSGLVKPLSERIDHEKGIKQGHIHVPFGKYILNKNKLDSDLVYFKHTKGYGVKGFPMSKVSSKLGSILRTIIGGGVPKFEELNGLTDQEKEYLHKVASKAGIIDKLSIPTPSKDKMEQDIHQFEVMKGELLSGNDSPELIKKFKLLLLRLSKSGQIPKREATELMEDLIQLGF